MKQPQIACDHHAGRKSLIDNHLREETPLKTFMPKAADITRKWYVVDAEGLALGRVASQVANILRGKNKPIYTPNVDTGDYVIVVNASKVILTGKKLDQKIYYKHSGFVGGLKETKYRKLLAEKPEEALRHAVVGMLPKGPLGRQMAKKLKIYAGAEHEHAAQQPEMLEL
jgi:large subunit ribosomal protein L13